jgi:hypothetical protein
MLNVFASLGVPTLLVIPSSSFSPFHLRCHITFHFCPRLNYTLVIYFMLSYLPDSHPVPFPARTRPHTTRTFTCRFLYNHVRVGTSFPSLNLDQVLPSASYLSPSSLGQASGLVVILPGQQNLPVLPTPSNQLNSTINENVEIGFATLSDAVVSVDERPPCLTLPPPMLSRNTLASRGSLPAAVARRPAQLLRHGLGSTSSAICALGNVSCTLRVNPIIRKVHYLLPSVATKNSQNIGKIVVNTPPLIRYHDVFWLCRVPCKVLWCFCRYVMMQSKGL